MAAPTIKQIEHAIKARCGNVTEAAKALGVARQSLHRRISQSETLQQALEDAREELVDLAEDELRKQVRLGNMTAIIWTLKANPAAKRRGWSEKSEVEHSGGVSIVLEWGDGADDNDPTAEAA